MKTTGCIGNAGRLLWFNFTMSLAFHHFHLTSSHRFLFNSTTRSNRPFTIPLQSYAVSNFSTQIQHQIKKQKTKNTNKNHQKLAGNSSIPTLKFQFSPNWKLLHEIHFQMANGKQAQKNWSIWNWPKLVDLVNDKRNWAIDIIGQTKHETVSVITQIRTAIFSWSITQSPN